MTKENNILKVGLLLDDFITDRYVYELIKRSLKSEHYQINLLVVQKNSANNSNFFTKYHNYIKRRGFKKFIENTTFKLIEKLESLILVRMGKYKNYFDKFDLNKFNINSLIVHPSISKSGLIYRYSKDDLKKIKAHKLDLLIRCGGGIQRGKILNICNLGVISFHHADNNINRGGPPGFWEVYNREADTGFIIQILKDELDGGNVLYKGSIFTKFFYLYNKAELYSKSNVFMHKIIENISKDKLKMKFLPKRPYYNKLYSTPSLLIQIIYLNKLIKIFFSHLLKYIFSIKQRWGVAYKFTKNWDDTVLWKSSIIKNPPNRFLADPFPWYYEGKHYCFVEDFCFKENKGCISVYEVNKDGYVELGVAIKEDFHLSYPFLFEDNNNLYMCPESYQNKDIRLYKCIEFPLKWELEIKLVENIQAVDTNIFYKNNKWWMLTNMDSSDSEQFDSELHIFWSDTLLSNKWYPHKLNPVICDSRRGRNGGLLFKNNDIYRVFQSASFYFYGKSFGVAKIIEISESKFIEEVDFEVKPNFFEDITGTHTYNFKNGLMVIDFVKNENIKK